MLYTIRVGVAVLGVAIQAWAAAPTVSNVHASQRAGSKRVEITYDVASGTTNVVAVVAVVSNATGVLSASHFSGDIGAGIATGTARQIVWDGEADLNGQILSNLRVCLTASDGGAVAPQPFTMVPVPAGTFSMGSSVATPIHPVEVSAFDMDRTEVTKAQWDAVRTWALANGYAICVAAGKAAGHPAQSMDWHSAVRWCNARSERDGLTPCYTNADGTVFKTGNFAGGCNWSADGYRLPTEAEWEYAARGTGTTNRFPWTDSNEIQHARANYWSYEGTPYDTSLTRGYHPAYNDGVAPYTSPAGSFAANAYGLCDMAGNVFEWCWDLYKAPYLTSPVLNPRGAATGSHRVIRGGSWGGANPSAAYVCTVTDREISTPDGFANIIGFRCVKATPAGGALSTEALAEAAAPLATPVASDPFTADFRDYTLTVASTCGKPAPASGTNCYAWSTTVTGAVPRVVSAGGTNWSCTGWAGTGSVPPAGMTNSTGPMMLTSQQSSITWQWAVSAVMPCISAQPQSRTNSCATTALFSVVAAGMPSVAYQWQCNGTNLVDGGRVSGAQSPTLAIANASPSDDAGRYRVILANAAGSVTSQAAVLTVSDSSTPAESRTIAFADAAYVTPGEGASGTAAFSAVVPVNGTGPASVSVFVLPGSAGTTDYVPPAKPVVLTWAEGETGPKTVSIPIKGDTLVEGNEVFYLALGTPSNGVIAEPRVCAVTIADDELGTAANKGVFVAGLPQPPEGGKVTGGAYCLPSRTVTLTATPNAGWTFLRWEDGTQVTPRKVSGGQAAASAQNGAMRCTALFKRTVDLPLPQLANPGAQAATVGVAFSLPLDLVSESLPKVTVTGLPAGLKYDAAKTRIVGAPALAGTFTLTIAATNPKGPATPQVFSLTAAPLPAWAQGTFSGSAGTDALGCGSAALNVTPAGGVSGKLTLRGSNFTFSAASYANRDDKGVFWLTATATVARASIPLTLAVYAPEYAGPAPAPEALGRADGDLGADGWLRLYSNVWKEPAMLTFAANTFSGYYTATLPGADAYGSGYLTFTVDKSGGVKTVGKLGDGTVVSLSGTLIRDEEGRTFTVLYTAPVAYKGGGLFGVAEFVTPQSGPVLVRLLDDPFSWLNLNPLATGEAGAGFSRGLGLTGGWYAKLGNLYDYYIDNALSVGTNAGAPVPALWIGTNRYESAGWNPNGLALTVATNSLSVLTGLKAPKAVLPVKVGGVYDYDDAGNALGLTVVLTRATGIFKGSFKAWFDYATTHTPKTISFEGVLTPERENKDDGVEGRGFFLWSDKAQYLSPLGKKVPYTFSWSYDFLLQGN